MLQSRWFQTGSRKLSCFSILMLLTVTGCSQDSQRKTDQGKGAENFAEAVLGTIQTPATNEFPKPDDAVNFLFTQIRERNFDAATKLFLAKEKYELITLEDHAHYLRMFSYQHTPIPGAKFHNLELAIQDLDLFDQLTLICLGFDIDQRRILNERDVAGDVEKLKAKLRYENLKTLEVQSISTIHEAQVSEGQRLLTALKATEEATVDVSINCAENNVVCTLGLLKVGTNWRINSLVNVSGDIE